MKLTLLEPIKKELWDFSQKSTHFLDNSLLIWHVLSLNLLT